MGLETWLSHGVHATLTEELSFTHLQHPTLGGSQLLVTLAARDQHPLLASVGNAHTHGLYTDVYTHNLKFFLDDCLLNFSRTCYYKYPLASSNPLSPVFHCCGLCINLLVLCFIEEAVPPDDLLCIHGKKLLKRKSANTYWLKKG